MKQLQRGFGGYAGELGSSELKWIAMLCMVIDHIGAVFEVQLAGWYDVFRLIGRFAFPIYCFLLVYGVVHTHSRFRYALRLLCFAFISEPCFDLVFHHTLLEFDSQNVFFTLFLSCCMLCVWDWCPKWWGRWLSVCAAAAAAVLLRCDYTYRGIFFVFCFDQMRRGADSGRRHIQTAAAVLFIAVDLFCFGRILTGDGRIAWPLLPQRLFGFYNQDVAVLALVLPAVYGEQRHGRQSGWQKWMYYAFYPAHLLALYFIASFV